jgi:hypothetical protein
MKHTKSILIQLICGLPLLLAAIPALAGGGGGGGGAGSGGAAAPEPGFLTLCAIVAGAELGRRVIKKNKS